MTAPNMAPTFSSLQTQGYARPPQQQQQSPYTGQMAYGQSPSPSMDPYGTGSQAQMPSSQSQPSYMQPPQPMQYSPVPDLQGQWSQLQGYANVGYGAPGTQQSNYQPSAYQGPGQFNAYQGSNYDPGAYHSGSQQQAGPGSQMQFGGSTGLGNMADMGSFAQIMQSLQNPSRYGAGEVGQAFNVLNNDLTQQGNADYQRINEDMARRGIYDSTTAGGRLGDLATNLNRQRQDFATNLATDQAKNYQSDRASAIAQAMGYGGQQFGQNLGGFNANLASQGQNFGQGLQANQFNENRGNTSYQNSLGRNAFLLGQNAQNFGQQAQQYGANQQEAQNNANSSLNNANFGLNQNQQNYAQNANQFNQQQGANQQTFQQMLAALTGQQGMQQQGFENQLATQGVNNQQQQAYMNMLLQMFGGAQ